jgi:hypothetical protein
MSAPHPSKDALNDDLIEFHKGVRSLREKHNLQNVVCLVQSTYVTDDHEAQGMAVQTIGDRSQALPMCAYAHGTLRNEFSDTLNQLVQGKAK